MSVENIELIDPNNTVHVIIDANMSVIDAEVAFEQMELIAQDKGETNLLIEIEDVKGVSAFKSIYKSRRFKWFAIEKVRKCAVISENNWGEYLSEVTNFLVPGIDIKDFGMDDAQEAIVWMNAPAIPRKYGLAIVRTAAYPHLMIYDSLKDADYELIKKELENFGNNTALIIELDEFDGFSLSDFWKRMKKNYPNSLKVQAISLVSNKKLKVVFESSADITPGVKLALFPAEAMQEAVDFVRTEIEK